MANNYKLTEQEIQKLIELLQQGKSIPSYYKSKLFDSGDSEFIEVTKDCKLVYKGKEPKEKIIANTPAAPFQKVRSFNSNNKFDDGWQNMLIFGDNLLALKTIYEDQRGENKYKTKNKIKLIYIDPPFATKQDFMKDREKAYRDKIIGAQFIEFLRRRLILLREILADDGTIYVHLDWKKGHYIKTIMDEIFGEYNFLNNVVWCYKTRQFSKRYWNRKHDDILVYAKNLDQHLFNWKAKYVIEGYSEATIKKYKYEDENGLYRLSGRGIQGSPIKSAKDVDPKWEISNPELVVREYLGEGFAPHDYWKVEIVNQAAKERQDYPTQKPEEIAAKIISASSESDTIVLDAFAGSGTTISVAEKLGRRWIGIDSGKLAIYTIQKRMLNITTQVGPLKKDERLAYKRVENFEEPFKSSRGLLFITEKARKGDLILDDTFLKNLAEFIGENLSGNTEEYFSICLPEEKFKLKKLKVYENEEDNEGEKIVKIGRIKFSISFVQPKEKFPKESPLKAKEFTLYNSGIYENKDILDLEWDKYKPFVSQLFGLRPEEHRIHGFTADGFIGTYSAFVWNYPGQKNLSLDTEYVQTLHTVLGGKAGDKFFVIAPVTAMAFMEDEIKIADTNYIFLKVPLSVLKALIEKGEPGSLRQPRSEADINEVIDAIGFDFISQPIVKVKYYRDAPLNPTLEDQDKLDFVIEMTEFKSDTLVYDPEDFENFETLSMVMIDNDYNGDYFNLSQVYWSDKIITEDKTRAVIRIPQDSFEGERMMVIYMDKYGNELKIIKTKEEFDAPRIQERRSSAKAKRRRKK